MMKKSTGEIFRAVPRSRSHFLFGYLSLFTPAHTYLHKTRVLPYQYLAYPSFEANLNSKGTVLRVVYDGKGTAMKIDDIGYGMQSGGGKRYV